MTSCARDDLTGRLSSAHDEAERPVSRGRTRTRGHSQTSAPTTCDHYFRLRSGDGGGDCAGGAGPPTARAANESCLRRLMSGLRNRSQRERHKHETKNNSQHLARRGRHHEQQHQDDSDHRQQQQQQEQHLQPLCQNQRPFECTGARPEAAAAAAPCSRRAAAAQKQPQRRRRRHKVAGAENSNRMARLIAWPLARLCLPLCLGALLLMLLLAASARAEPQPQQQQVGAHSPIGRSRPDATKSSRAGPGTARQPAQPRPPLPPPPGANINQVLDGRRRARSLLAPINELRVSGSKLEPPSRPSQDWSRQRPHFGPNIQRDVSVELGKTAHLTCKVLELGDRTVSWLRPRANEILTAGRFTYIGDARFSSLNEPGSADWILEIKDANLNDSASYECQVSTDPKMSATINLHVQAGRARIRQGENNYYPVGANIEFACEILPPSGAHHARYSYIGGPASLSSGAAPAASAGAHEQAQQQPQQIYWYHNGNLINYAKADSELSSRRAKFAIDWDPAAQTSRLRLIAIQPADAGNYTCKPGSAEPATVRLFVKKPKVGAPNRVHYSGGSHLDLGPRARAGPAEAPASQAAGLEPAEASAGSALARAPSLRAFCALSVLVWLLLAAV